MRPKHLFLKLAMSLILLATGIAPVFAGWEYQKIDGGEGGGGTYTFRNEKRYFGYDGDSYDSNHLDWFWTRKRFDGDKDQFYFEFEMRVCCDMIIEYDKKWYNKAFSDSEVKQTLLEGEVYVVTQDDVLHKLGTWKKAKTDGSYVTYSVDDDQQYGSFHTYNLNTDNGHVNVRFLPRRQAFLDGVKRIIFKNRLVFKDTRQWGWFQYEKDIDLNYFNEDKPMPKLSYDWNVDGSLTFTATDMRDITKDSRYKSQTYDVTQYLFFNNSRIKKHDDFNLVSDAVTLTHKSGNKMDIQFSKWYVNGGAFTTPVFLKYRGESNVSTNDTECGFSDVWYYQTYVTVMVDPYTRPENIVIEFDKWNKSNTITWSKREKAYYYDGSNTGSVDCKTDGKWYVLRYDKGVNVKTDGYKLLGSFNGTSSNLKYTDKDIEYDKDYTYRVVFLPSFLEEKYKENLVNLPGQSSSHSSSDLWDERTVSTLMEAPIKLSQDRSYEKAVRLVWEYNIQLKGLDWRIDYRPLGTTAWKTLGETLPIDIKQSETHFDTDGTVCDLIEYRVRTTVNGKELYSNVLTGNLPVGSYISEVKATTGTEDGLVIVRWKVARADISNEAYYRVLRRPMGAEEWTLLDDATHGTASEYEYKDTRVAAGTYYEYTVEAYGAKCDEQFVQTSSMIAPGFSQARGTITGHVAFGSGTAVNGVRVNLVKSSADESSDTPQYLSRYIDGEGKGLTWTADSTKYASILNGKSELTLQLWAKPMMEGGESKQAFLHLANAIELGVKRISDPSDYDVTVELPEGYDADGRFIIASVADWEHFASLVNSGNTKLNAVMAADIDLDESQTMIGDTEANCYRGHFDGNGHTLKVNYYVHSTTDRDGNYRTAPFSYVGDGFELQNLHVTGKISTNAKFAGGIVGGCVNGAILLTRCWSSVTIEGRAAGDGTHGGLISITGASSLKINSCLFDGVIMGEGLTNCAGMVGWIHDGYQAQLTNCLVNPESVPVSEGFYTYARSRYGSSHKLSNCYYTKVMGHEQGQSIAATDLTPSILGVDWTSNNLSQVVPQLIETEVSNLVSYNVNATVKNAKVNDPTNPVYCLYAVDLTSSDCRDYTVTEFQNLPFNNSDFTHVTARYKGGNWIFSVGKDSLICDTLTISNNVWNSCSRLSSSTLSLGGSSHNTGSTFKGNVDDVRLWSRALTTKEIDNNFDRILGGVEKDLVLYWPLDEGVNIRDYAFDVTKQDGICLENHPEIGANAVPSAVVPESLKLYGMTDAEGDYIIRGIPFQQDGTNYKVVPAFGIHQFSPNSSSMFVSPTSLTANNVNFEDVSAFPMEGYIYYYGTNIPAEGVMLYVDGDLQSKDGKAQQTDADGYYKISVPIGKHYVEAKLDGHTMAMGGRFPYEGTYNFDRAMTYDFADSTLVNFVGRVGGGERNDTLAVGFGASKNNIGIATITLKLNNESFSFNCQNDHITPATMDRSFESDTTSINSNTWAGIGNKSKYIYIRTDSLTGEFSAKLPPLKYITKSVKIDSNPDIEFTSLPEIDLTTVTKTLNDSIKVTKDGGVTSSEYYSYNTKQVFAYYAVPTLNIWQSDNSEGAFGERNILRYEIASGDSIDIYDIWKKEADGSINYRFNYPIFQMDEPYTFKIRGYEAYVNKDASSKVITDTIPLNDLTITIANEMGDEQSVISNIANPDSTGLKAGEVYNLKKNQKQLDEYGMASYSWNCGAPNVTAPYTRNFSVSFEKNGRTYVWDKLYAIALGELSQGNNFVTEGPDKPLMVLRDPPGAKSKTTWKSGKTTTKVRTSTKGWVASGAAIFNLAWGVKMETVEGMGFALVSKYQQSTIWDIKGKHQHTLLNKHEETWSTTVTDAVSTGTDIYHVGSPGDVFIGISNNFQLGDCTRLGFFKGIDGSIHLDCRDATMLSLQEKTSFYYSAYEIENVMIPKWKELRYELLTELPTKEACEKYENNSSESVYLTWYKKDSEVYGDSGTYIWKGPKDLPGDDKINYYNQQVKLWEGILAWNERDKWEAINDINIKDNKSYHVKNISFDGGTSYSYSERRDSTDVTTHDYSGQESVYTNFRHHMKASAGGYFDSDWGFEIETGFKWSEVSSDEDENTKNYVEFSYDFSDGNRGTDFSVDIYKSPRGYSNSFSILGGQSYNPYEGPEYAKYFEKKEKHLLSNGTQRMEQPDIRISVDGQQSAKTLTVTDIPAGQKKNLVLHLTNNNQTQQPFDMTYNLIVVETSNNNGLQVYMDGVPMNGRSVLIPKNETVLKNITISQTDQSKLKHEGVKIRFASPYQPLSIYDEVTLNATFVPSSSPVDLIISEPVFNSDSPDSLELKIANFDRNFTGLKYVGVQYKFEGSTSWSEFCRFDSAYIAENIVPDRGYLRKWIDMRSDVSYPQGTYAFRAFTMTKYGYDDVYAYSDEVTVIKDNISPRALTTPTPANGILGFGDDMSIEFNEDIVPGYVGPKNVIVTSKLNGAPIDHEVSLKMISRGSASHTVNPVFLNGDFTLDFWVKWTEGGQLICQGVTAQLFRISIDNDGAVALKMGDTELKSIVRVPRDTWTYMVMSYKSSEQTVSMLAEWDIESKLLFDKETVDFSTFEALSSSSENYLYIGRGIVGAIHDLGLYNVCLDVLDAASKKYNSKDNYVYGLLHYWPMNEGHGTVAADMRHINDLIVNDRWEINNVNYSLNINQTDDVYADISRINTSAGESYAIELWCEVTSKSECTLFETGRSDLTRLRLRYDSLMNLVLDYGEKSQVVANNEDFPDHSHWHHLAFNVVRGQAASFYYNGQRTAVISEQDVPTFEGSRMKLGTGLSGYIDELRIWHATITEKRLLANIYQCLDTADVYSRGLVAYYPFEKLDTINGVPTKGATLKNLAPVSHANSLVIHADEKSLKNSSVPPLKNALEETRLIASPVASERKVVVNLTGAGITPRDIEGTTLNITVAQIHDMHGNVSQPIRWTAYVQQNTLKWEKDSVNVFKMYGDDASFDVNIVNKGGTVEYYTLQNLPQWLTLVESEITDDVAPLSTKTLRFRVNPLTPIGDYDLNIGLQGNYEISEPLRLVVKVRGEKPNWSVEPTAYEHQMTIIGHVRLNGFIMENPESLVAAFIDGQCRGLASPANIRNGAYVTLNVYGDSYENMDYHKPVTFSIWDAATGMTYVDVNVTIPDNESGQVLFEHDLLLGDYNSPVVWTKSNKAEQHIPVHVNWNWIALGVQPENSSPYKVFADYDGWALTIKDHGSQVAWSNGTQWKGTLSVGANTMYKLRVTSLPSSPVLPTRLAVTGQQVNLSETPVELYEEWNWIAYTPLYTMTVGEALAGANPAIGDRIKSQTGIAIYGPNGWEGNLTALESGHGYLYFNSTPGYKTFVYPPQTRSNAGPLKAPRLMALARMTDQPTLFTPIDKHLYPDNMTMVVQLTDGEAIVDTCEVAVFIDGECRAASRSIDGLYYLIIAGEGSNVPMEIVTYLDGRLVLLDNSHVFVSDDNIGDPWSPYVIDLQHLPDGISDINADDFDPDAWYTLQGFRLSGRPESPGIYIHNGQKVALDKKAVENR